MGLLAWLAAGALALPALAQTPPAASSSHDAALSEFQQARRLIDAGDCAGALPHLDESLVYEPSVGARLSVADCVESSDPLRAWRSLADAALLAHLSHDERLAVIEKRLGQLERNVPLIRLKLTRLDLERRGFEVIVDGKPVDRYHVQRPIAVAAGPHAIEVRAAGTTTWQRAVEAPAIGEAVDVSVVLVEAREAPVSSTPSAPQPLVVTIERTDPRAARRTAGLVLGVTGVAALATGAVFGVLVLSKGSELDDACGGSRDRCQSSPAQVAPLRDNASTLAAVSTASFIVGGAAVLGGLALYLWPGPASATRRIGIAPMLGATSGLRIEGGF